MNQTHAWSHIRRSSVTMLVHPCHRQSATHFWTTNTRKFPVNPQRPYNGMGILCSYCAKADIWAQGRPGPQVSLGATVHSTTEDHDPAQRGSDYRFILKMSLSLLRRCEIGCDKQCLGSLGFCLLFLFTRLFLLSNDSIHTHDKWWVGNISDHIAEEKGEGVSQLASSGQIMKTVLGMWSHPSRISGSGPDLRIGLIRDAPW
jgi:hypothetical protein